MQIKTDGRYLIFTPETKIDYFDLGRCATRNPLYEIVQSNRNGGDTGEMDITSFKLKKEYLLKILLQGAV
jgi:hypothetical protein